MNYNQEEILITGADGLVGKKLKALFPNSIFISHKDFDLTSENEVKYMFYLHQPRVVIHLAARVGSVHDNQLHQAFYFDDNILMNTLMVKHAYLNNVEKFMGILSSYAFPENKENSNILEGDMHLGPPAVNNFSYSYAKRALAVQIDSYNHQFGTKYNYITPCNIFGEDEKIDLNKSHFIIAMLLKIKKAIKEGKNHITLFGDGSPKRQFMYSGDFANVIKYIIDNDAFDNINIAPDLVYSINEVAELALKITGNEHLKILYDTDKPNGQLVQIISTKKFKSTIKDFKFTSLGDGILKVYNTIN